MRLIIWSVCISLLVLVPVLTMTVMQPPQFADAQAPGDTPTYFLFLPGVAREPTLTPTPEATLPTPGLDWDPRLTLRQATLVPATVQPGQGYWKLVKGVWYDVNDTRPMGVGDHDIAYDVRSEAGERILGKSLKVGWWVDGACPSAANFWLLPGPLVPEVELPPLSVTDYCVNIVQTQDKGTEIYAGSYPMYHTTGTYRIEVDDGTPSDAVENLGMGTIAEPYVKYHTSYGFVWRWTIYNP